MGAVFGRVNLPKLYSHTGGDLHGGSSELMAICACRPSIVVVFMIMVVVAWNKFASDLILVGCCEAVVGRSGSRLTNRDWCGDDTELEVDFMPWPCRCVDTRSGVDMVAWRFCRSVMTLDL